MSTFVKKTIQCPSCGVSQTAQVAVSINGARHTEVQEKIRAGVFQHTICQSCETHFEIDLPLIYMDFSQKLWISMFPLAWEHRWSTLEKEPEQTFRTNMFTHAPPIVRAMRDKFSIRCVFGLSALREKILLHEAGVDDAWMEVAKLDLMRNGIFGSFHPTNRPRTSRIDLNNIRLNNVFLARSRIQDLKAQPIEWLSGFSAVTGGPYVDIGRLFYPV